MALLSREQLADTNNANGANGTNGTVDVLHRSLHFIGDTPAFHSVVEQCESIAPHDITVLLVGETGAGKDLCARAIHQLSPRASGPFIPLECAALPETLFARELFGHEKGAFTDARETKKGLVEMAAGGTLVLDEVESLNLGSQGTLLRLLDTKTWRALGSNSIRPLNCRILATSNLDLLQLVQQKTFRADLYYRLGTSVITLPPLRERREDILLLVQHFLDLYGEAYQKEDPALSDEALAALYHYDYPGNIRELQNILQQAILRASGSCIRLEDLNLPTPIGKTPRTGWKEARRQAISTWEKAYLSHLLSTSSGNISYMAGQLGLSRQVVYRLLKRYQILPSYRTRTLSPH